MTRQIKVVVSLQTHVWTRKRRQQMALETKLKVYFHVRYKHAVLKATCCHVALFLVYWKVAVGTLEHGTALEKRWNAHSKRTVYGTRAAHETKNSLKPLNVSYDILNTGAIT
jgi:hypothetical protein